MSLGPSRIDAVMQYMAVHECTQAAKLLLVMCGKEKNM